MAVIDLLDVESDVLEVGPALGSRPWLALPFRNLFLKI
jgi:hypothetical protein